jgi:glycosyltransferase involved in cell wall biosynthesis
MADLILFDITRLAGRLRIHTPTGIDRVEFAYARHLAQHHRASLNFVMHWRGHFRALPTKTVLKYLDVVEHQWGVSQPDETRRLTQKIGAFLGDTALAEGLDSNVVRQQRRDMRRLWRLRLRISLGSRRLRLPPRPAGECRFYVNVSQEGVESREGIMALSQRDGVHPVFLLHDLIPITHPEYMRPGFAARHARRLDTMLNAGATVLTNSAFTADELRDYAQRKGLPVPPIAVALLSFGFDVREEEPVFHPKEPYFVCLGTIEPRKNHIFLLQLWRQMVERLGDKAPKLLLIGRRGWENENAISLIERCAAIQGHVLECGAVPDIILQRLVRGASAILFPSFAEGYGMPLVEAMSLGVPVIASDLTVFREVTQGIPEFLDPIDGPAWMSLIEDYADPASQRRTIQVERIRDFSAPTWADHFRVFDQAIDAIRSRAAPEPAPAPAVT